jgi:hypothetical protein
MPLWDYFLREVSNVIRVSVSGYFNSFNDFKIKEILVSDEDNVFILKESEAFLPYRYAGNLTDLFDSVKNLYYPSYAMSTVRCHRDDDAKSLANFLMQKIQAFNLNETGAHKRLFDTLSVFGDTCYE